MLRHLTGIGQLHRTLRVNEARDTGRKGFTLDDTFERRRRLYIGDFPGWSVVAAHERAKRLSGKDVDQRSILCVVSGPANYVACGGQTDVS